MRPGSTDRAADAPTAGPSASRPTAAVWGPLAAGARTVALVAAGAAGGTAALLRLVVLPVLEAGAGLLDPNLGTALAGRIAVAGGSLLLALVGLCAVASTVAAFADRRTPARPAVAAAAALLAALALRLRSWPATYEAYALVDRALGAPAVHAERAASLHTVADLVLAGLCAALFVAIVGLVGRAGAGAAPDDA